MTRDLLEVRAGTGALAGAMGGHAAAAAPGKNSSARQLPLLAAAVALAPRTHVELQHDVEIVGRWQRRTNVWRRITSPGT
jgi:hypothetical protein